MNGLIITHKGMEGVCKQELCELASPKKTKTEEGVVLFEIENHEEFCTLCYTMQSAEMVLYFLGSCTISSDLALTEKALVGCLEKADITSWLEDGTVFKVSCRREGEHDFTSQEVIKIVTSSVLKHVQGHKKNVTSSFKGFSLIIHVHIQDAACYVGIDLAGFDLSKRDYKIFTSPQDIRATVGYGVLRLSGAKRTDMVLNMFCKSSTIAIEAARFFLSYPTQYHQKGKFLFRSLAPFKSADTDALFRRRDQCIEEKFKGKVYAVDTAMPSIVASKKNAKIAGVAKHIEFSRNNLEWLDTKFGKEGMSHIIAHVPSISKRKTEHEIAALYQELFYQARYILSKKGRITTLSYHDEPLVSVAQRENYCLLVKHSFFMGKQELFVCVFAKNTAKKEEPKKAQKSFEVLD